MKALHYLMIFILSMGITTAQEIKITGTVTDTKKLPLPGVNVTIKGNKQGAQTDFDGKYAITAKIGDKLEFTYVGFEIKVVKVTGKSNVIDVKMREDASALEEVIVIGYGTTTRRSMTASVSTISTQSNLPKSNLNQQANRRLQGKVAGVSITSASGKKDIKVRGVGTIKAAKKPLYIVDGVPIAEKDIKLIQTIDPATISKSKEYKGSKAQAIFGAKAANGCIVITTHAGNYRVQNDESYKEIIENDFKRVHASPLSTFSIDVDKASYSNIRRMINNGTKVPADAVKVEEMINYFDYAYAQPTGKHPFAIHTEHTKTPWNPETQLVKIGIKGKEIAQQNIPASNLVFLIDVSGSMDSPNKLHLLKKAFKLLVNQLREKDKVSIVVYAGAAGMVLNPTSGAYKNKIMQALDNLQAGGSTAGGAGIELAYKIAKDNFIKNGNNRVILATDGDFNVGMSSDKDMKDLIEEKRKSRVFLTCLGFGMGNYKDSKLETLADKGNGNHAYIDTLQEAQRVLGTEFGGTLYTIAKDVKIQVEFNPAKVQAYRLIGYENRLLADEDFVDDTKDAGELGSGHTVTAFYEVIPVGLRSEYLKEVATLKYTLAEPNKDYGDELLTVKFRYKKPQEDTSIEMIRVLKEKDNPIASPELKFAAAVAWFGMKLRGSKYLKKDSFSDIVNLSKEGRGYDKHGYRAEFIRLVNSYQGL
ncbi:VWA domain-containing protein [Aquimarina sp. MMG016]|uniref:VWA domain-containing protein n=1 Tax=Aquimarina sp. MMG016 TaxID=2822690 RepID=UPI001B3A6C6D|nr:VWA domain-containing protein [Aquimarina sp. MMG016]MBQ4819594.1 von Willebrand factor type A domain-containing protein [Aquimarina sp. MMG016]